MSTRQSQDTVWTKINVLAAVLASLVALAGLVFTVRVAGGADASSTAGATPSVGSLQPASPSSGSVTSSGPAPLTSRAAVLPLTALPLDAGAGNATTSGTVLSLPCGTNQSDDTYRELEYGVPTTRGYRHFSARVQGGDGGTDQVFTVTVSARGQYVRADQTLQIAAATVRPGAASELRGDLEPGVDTLFLRLVCHLPGASVMIIGAQLSG